MKIMMQMRGRTMEMKATKGKATKGEVAKGEVTSLKVPNLSCRLVAVVQLLPGVRISKCHWISTVTISVLS